MTQGSAATSSTSRGQTSLTCLLLLSLSCRSHQGQADGSWHLPCGLGTGVVCPQGTQLAGRSPSHLAELSSASSAWLGHVPLPKGWAPGLGLLLLLMRAMRSSGCGLQAVGCCCFL